MTAQHIHRAPERICTCCGKSLAAGEFYAALRQQIEDMREFLAQEGGE